MSDRPKCFIIGIFRGRVQVSFGLFTRLEPEKNEKNNPIEPLRVQLGLVWCGQQDLNLHELVLTRT